MAYFLFFIFLSVFLEGIFTSIPLALSALAVFYILEKKYAILPCAFMAGLVLDVFRLRTLGLTGIFFLLFILIIFLYEKKFEIKTMPFVFFSSFLGSLIYLVVFGHNNVLPQASISSIIAVVSFYLIQKFKTQKY